MLAVVGSLNLDLVAPVPHIPRPGETVLGGALARHQGGKGGNQAVAAARLGAPVRFYGAVGRDPFGDELAAGLAAEGVDTSGLLRVDGPSGCALINVGASGENAISVLPGANAHAPGPPRPFPHDLRWLLMQLELPLPTVMAWADAAHAAGVPVVLNAAPMTDLPPDLLARIDVLIVNERELLQIGGDDLAALSLRGPKSIIATMGARGAVGWHRNRHLAQPAHDVWVVDTTGAGDTFTGAFVASLALGHDFERALARASFAASLACTKHGARAGMPHEIDLRLAMKDWQTEEDRR